MIGPVLDMAGPAVGGARGEGQPAIEVVLDRSDDAVLRGTEDAEHTPLQVGNLQCCRLAAACAAVGGEPDQQRLLLGQKQIEHALPSAWSFSQPSASLLDRLVCGHHELMNLARAQGAAGDAGAIACACPPVGRR
jgi:hypothetical protein